MDKPQPQLVCDLTLEVPADEQLELEQLNNLLHRDQQSDLHALMKMTPRQLRTQVVLKAASSQEYKGKADRYYTRLRESTDAEFAQRKDIHDLWQMVLKLTQEKLQLKAELEQTQELVVSGFWEEEYPTFRQGVPVHELEMPLDALTASNLVAAVRRYNLKLKETA